MCGRAYLTYTDEELELRYQSKRPAHLRLPPTFSLTPTYNFAPDFPLSANTERVAFDFPGEYGREQRSE